MRWWRWGAAGAIAAALAIVVTVAVLLSDGGSGPGRLSPYRNPALHPAEPRNTPDDGELRVVDQGFTQRDAATERTLTRGYRPGRPEPYKPVYTAFTLQNTSTRDAVFQPIVKVTYYDDKNRPVADHDDNWTFTAPMMPDSTTTFAGYLNIDSITVTRITVEVVSAKWLPAADAKAGVAPLNARDVKVLPTTIPGLTTVTYTAGNGLAVPIAASGLVIFRDAAGKLLGAESTDTVGMSTISLPPGDSTGSTTFKSWFPPGTDPSRLQVTLRPGNLAPDR
jgi:hypothetical protein